MMHKRTLLAAGMVAAISLGTSALALAHGPGGSSGNPYHGWSNGCGMGQGQMGPGMMGQGQMGPGMMGQGQMGPGMMGPGMMGQGQMGPGMMGQGMGQGMGRGMMGPGMMGQGMGQGMGPGMMGQGQMGPGMMGQGMGQGMGRGMMGSDMMGQGQMGQGQMGPGMMHPLRQDLTAADVQHMMEHRLSWQGNPNVKVGKVEEKDDDTIVAEIVTKDGSLVQKLEVDRHTGWMRPAQ